MNWSAHATERLDEAGHRSGRARRAVVELLAEAECALTALEIDRRIDSVGRASVYRTLDQLEQLQLIQRVEVGGDATGYERVDPADHHHHLVCQDCGRLSPFTSEPLEGAIEAVGRSSGFALSSHDVVLRGTCPDCGEADA
ncbi:MAG TPA: Fur family transcriptional regulator [Solirubrobacterales bacterium]|nr:Fur family transcriptional regulator [Solirubrobacterales bacterium]